MVERLLARLPDLRLAVERGALPRRPANFISGIEAMPVEFTPSRARWATRGPLMAGPGRPGRGIAGWSILVTGGGSGIGLATAERLAADGAHVTICGRTEQKLADADGADRGRGAAAAPRSRYVVADVTVEDRCRRGGRHAPRRPAASTGSSPAPAARRTSAPSSPPTWPRCAATVDLNLMGSVICVKQGGAGHAGPGRTGRHRLMSSGAGRFPHPHLWAYGVSKAGICFLAETAAEELGPLGIRVNAVAPGIIDDELMSLHHRRRAAARRLPRRRCRSAAVGTVEDVAAAVRYLIGPESSFVTGETLGVDGGHHLRRGADYSLLFGG